VSPLAWTLTGVIAVAWAIAVAVIIRRDGRRP
jgi:hypothetical protein